MKTTVMFACALLLAACALRVDGGSHRLLRQMMLHLQHPNDYVAKANLKISQPQGTRRCQRLLTI